MVWWSEAGRLGGSAGRAADGDGGGGAARQKQKPAAAAQLSVSDQR